MKEQMLLVFNPAVTLSGQEETPPHGVKGDGHLAFAVTEPELTGWRKRLGEFKVEIEKEMTWPSGGKSIYFRDPAGNSLEFATSKIWGIQEKV
jgi:catechol 2,3-dioxygenase-like lactoylglutathione lyase family enzyme